VSEVGNISSTSEHRDQSGSPPRPGAAPAIATAAGTAVTIASFDMEVIESSFRCDQFLLGSASKHVPVTTIRS
jgi:hypothetical protein